MVQFGVGSGTKCLNLNPEVWQRFGCEPGAPEVWDLNWAKYGNRSQKKIPPKFPNLGSGAGLAKMAICCTLNLNLRCSLGSHLVMEVHELNH